MVAAEGRFKRSNFFYPTGFGIWNLETVPKFWKRPFFAKILEVPNLRISLGRPPQMTVPCFSGPEKLRCVYNAPYPKPLKTPLPQKARVYGHTCPGRSDT